MSGKAPFSKRVKDLTVGAGNVHLLNCPDEPSRVRGLMPCRAWPIPFSVWRQKSADDSANNQGSALLNCEISSWAG